MFAALIRKMESFPNIATDGVLTSWSTSIEEWWLLQNRIIRDGTCGQAGEFMSEEAIRALQTVATLNIENKQKMQDLLRSNEQLLHGQAEMKNQLAQLSQNQLAMLEG